MSEKIIQLEKIFKIYKSGTVENQLETVALENVALDIYKDDFISIMGPSGSGKTTLLNLLSGLDQPTAGKILYQFSNGNSSDTKPKTYDLSKMSEKELDEFRHNKIGVIFQNDNLLHHLTAFENVELPLIFLKQENVKEKVEYLLDKVGLSDRMHHYPSQLSAGERQRVALCAALSFKPLLIIADEPTGELDSKNVADIMDLFYEISEQEGVIFVIVTHNPTVAKYAKRYFSLYDGRLIEVDQPTIHDDISLTSGEYRLEVDKFSRILLPFELLSDLDITEGLVTISRDNQVLTIAKPNVHNIENQTLIQLDSQNRMLLPKNLIVGIDKSSFLAKFDDEMQQIKITFMEVMK